MANRRKEKDEEEDKPFKIPKFDEKAFLKREKRNIKTSFISFLFGCFMALVCFGFWVLMGKDAPLRWELVFLVGFINAVFLRHIFTRLNIDLADFGRKNWFGSYAIYFFTWLIVFIVLVNPPFYDDEIPHIDIAVLPEIQEPGGDIKIVAKISDNVGIDKDSIHIEIYDPNDNMTEFKPGEFDHDDLIAIFTYENPENLVGTFNYVITAFDTSGLIRNKRGSFTYKDSVMEITSSRFNNITSGDDITIEVDEEVSSKNFRVYYKLNDDEDISVNRKYKDIKAEYVTSPEYKGWEEFSSYNMSLFIEVSYYFENVFEKYSNIIEHTETYNFSTTQGSSIGDEDPPVPWNWSKPYNENRKENLLNYDKYSDTKDVKDQVLLPYPTRVQAPGFELIVFLVSLIVVLLIFKKRKKNKSNQK
ncbi:MAG: hypothetical protein JSW62_02785 [Thermoplasmatales archaeon]|nr:MAG: hypothetical protein JSW62_02785 [Thermoplasmatales archaeon]